MELWAPSLRLSHTSIALLVRVQQQYELLVLKDALLAPVKLECRIGGSVPSPCQKGIINLATTKEALL